MCLPRGTTSRTVAPARSRAASCGRRNSPRRRVAPASAWFMRLAASQTVSPSGTPTMIRRGSPPRRSAARDLRLPWQHPGSDRGGTERAGGGAGLRRRPGRWHAAHAGLAQPARRPHLAARRRPAAAVREVGTGRQRARPRERGGAVALGRPVHAGPGRPGARRGRRRGVAAHRRAARAQRRRPAAGWPIPGRRCDAIGAGLRALHDALPVAGCPFDWSAAARVARGAPRRCPCGRSGGRRSTPA